VPGGYTSVAAGAYSPLYSSPQQRKGGKPDPRDDVYSLGVIWYQLLSGELDEGAPTGDAWQRRLEEAGMTSQTLALLVECLERKAEDRPADAAVLAERLGSALEAKTKKKRKSRKRPTLSGKKLLQGDHTGGWIGGIVMLVLFVVCCAGGLGSWLGPRGGRNTGAVVTGTSWPDDSPQSITNSIGMKLRLIPKGKFMMGSPEEVTQRKD